MNPMRLPPILVPVLFAACAAAPGAQAPLPGTSWKLASADRGPLAARAAGSGITLAFDAGRMSGHGGCNQYGASYTVEGEQLRPGPVVATKRACIGAGNEVEAAWFAQLAQPLAYSHRDGRLVLRGADGTELGFVPAGD